MLRFVPFCTYCRGMFTRISTQQSSSFVSIQQNNEAGFAQYYHRSTSQQALHRSGQKARIDLHKDASCGLTEPQFTKKGARTIFLEDSRRQEIVLQAAQ